MALLSVSLVILGIVFFLMAVVLQQGWMIQRELWAVQRSLLSNGTNSRPGEDGAQRGANP
jgi:hypothetical protein